MAQVRTALLSNLTHVSTFSGGGGTCLGFRLAGFRTLWANDINAHARACYAANLDSPIDGRDIRHVTAANILDACGLGVGELDVFEGSPPCTAFSTAGKQAKGWRQTKEHAGIVQTNIEDLFYEWLRLLDGLRPRAFVAENVAGLVRGAAKGYFKDILRRMKALEYHVEARLLDAQWLGVPQSRTRVIFVGMRNDLHTVPVFPAPLPYRYSVHDALPAINFAIHREGGFSQKDVSKRPSRTLTNQSHLYVVQSFHQRREFTIDEVKRICSFPDDYILSGSYVQQWTRLGNSVPPLMAYAVAVSVRDVLLKIAEVPA